MINSVHALRFVSRSSTVSSLIIESIVRCWCHFKYRRLNVIEAGPQLKSRTFSEIFITVVIRIVYMVT